MKSCKLSKTALVTLGLLLSLGLTARAEDTAKSAKPKHEQKAQPADLAKLEADVGLSPEQKSQVDALLRELNDRRRAVRDDKALDKKQGKAKIKTIDSEIFGKIKALMTPEQFAKWEHLQEARRAAK